LSWAGIRETFCLNEQKRLNLQKKTHGSVARVPLMYLYLLARLASKNGKTDIGDTLVKEQFPLGSLPAFFAHLSL